MSRRAQVGVVLAAAVLIAVMPLAGRAPAADAPVGAADVLDLVCLAGGRPTLLRLHVRLDDKPLSSAWDVYLTAPFAFLDRDGDGVLNAAEARRAPSPDQLLLQFEDGFYTPPAGSGARFADMDADRDHKVTRAELAAYYRAAGVGPLRIVALRGRGPAEAALTEALFARLDRDRDGKLSLEELSAAPGLLRTLDHDDDEFLSPEELAPGLARRLHSVPPALPLPTLAGESLPLFVVPPAGTAGHKEARPRLRDRLLARYDKNKDGKLSRAESGLDGASFDRLDADGSGSLEPAELLSFPDLPPAVELLLRPGSDGARKAPLEIVKAGGARKSADGCIRLELEGVRVDLGVVRHAAETAGMRSFYLQQFRAADKDYKGRLMVEDVDRPAFRLLRTLFATADRDGDGKLTEKELITYLDLHATGAAAYATLVIDGRLAGLFELLDADGDGRLSIHELTAARKRLAPSDRDGDGRIARDELPYRFRFLLDRGRLRPLQSLGEAAVRLSRSAAGPVWFRLLDRNDDGYLSPREFPGTLEDFKRLDTDGDGLIGVEEAEKADTPARKILNRG